jgi:hypothetical protein
MISFLTNFQVGFFLMVWYNRIIMIETIVKINVHIHNISEYQIMTA